MEIKAIQLKKFYKNSDSMYKNIIITSLRARQIIDERYEKVSQEENIEDSDQLESLIIEDSIIDELTAGAIPNIAPVGKHPGLATSLLVLIFSL